MLEARSEPRDVCQIEATIVVGPVAVPCRVENLSEKGAKLAVEDEIELPPTFQLQLPIFDTLSETRVVECRWRIGGRVGVRFVQGSEGR